MIKIEQIQVRLNQSIKESAISKEEICKRVGISLTTLEKYITKKSIPTVHIFAKLCAVLEIDANDILCINKYTFS